MAEKSRWNGVLVREIKRRKAKVLSIFILWLVSSLKVLRRESLPPRNLKISVEAVHDTRICLIRAHVARNSTSP